jgi:hypothetical protein
MHDIQDVKNRFKAMDLSDKVDLLNALMQEGLNWEETRARLEHTDEFGDEIDRGETYYKKHKAHIEYTKMSSRSMSTMIEAVFGKNPRLIRFAERLLNAQHEAMIALIDSPRSPSLKP